MCVDQRPAREPLAQRRDAVGEHVGARLPRHHPARRHDPLVGVERAQHLVRVPPGVELHRADRDAARFEVVDRRDHGRRRVEIAFGAVPVRAAVVGPVRHARAEHVAVTFGRRDARFLSQQLRPPGEALARAVARDDRQLGREPLVDRVDVAVPSGEQTAVGNVGSRGHADHLFVEAAERRQQDRAPVGRDQPERQHDRGPDRQESPARQRGVAEHGQRELGVLMAERAQPVGHAAGRALRRVEVPADGGLRELAGSQGGQRTGGLQAQHEHRLPALERSDVGCDRTGRGLGYDEPAGPEPVGFVPSDAQHVPVERARAAARRRSRAASDAFNGENRGHVSISGSSVRRRRDTDSTEEDPCGTC